METRAAAARAMVARAAAVRGVAARVVTTRAATRATARVAVARATTRGRGEGMARVEVVDEGRGTKNGSSPGTINVHQWLFEGKFIFP